ncbi:FAD-dependent thymidylate synthase [Clostridium arbusti]|uniref:FAD-dependent thymidylate synthase n=1 Tax=Clostridium arbusti TaxID=1137848 RepID=UPI0002885358|nr:FAD-dependent thymidylate synthase [Clostridium arbusti]
MSLKVKLIEYTPNPEKVVAASAKLCYSSSSVDDIMKNLNEDNINKFINMLMSYGHHSPIEHVSFTFAIEGVSRSLTHQLVRHRLASYSQQSQRYVRLKQFQYIIPPAIEKNQKAREIFQNCMIKDQEAYDELVKELKSSAFDTFKKEYFMENKLTVGDIIDEKHILNLLNKAEKKAIEDARYVFPNACETKIIVTMNARELMHFFSERCCNRAQWEIRAMSNRMLNEVKKVSPILFKYSGPDCVRGICPEGSMTCGKTLEVRKLYLNE